MCGIAGFADFRNQLTKESLIKMTDALSYRGPDASGYIVENLPDASVGLGHRRLSILDLSPLGNQPYEFEDLRMIFNGEIYNFEEIKKDLEKEGYTFKSTSDTEMIIKAYHHWGISCVDRFIGMFAIAILDISANKLHLIRDRAGVKPLNFYWKDGLFLFSSELKSFHEIDRFHAEIDPRSISSYFKYSYVTSPNTIFKNTFKVKPGCILSIDIASGELNENKYWDVIDVYNQPKLDISYDDARDELEKILISSCNYRMVADVPVGVFLSGGYDSTTVTALLANHHPNTIKTYTIGFEDQEFDEAPHAKKISDYLGTSHTEYYCTQKEALDIIPDLPHIYDEPLGDNSVIPTTLVSKLAVQSVKVALSSDAGDEIFAGYPRYQQALKYSSMLPKSLQKVAGGVMENVNPEILVGLNRKQNFNTRFQKMASIWRHSDPYKAMELVMQFHTEQSLQKLIPDLHQYDQNYFDLHHEINSGNDAVNGMMAIDYLTFLLDNNLPKVDRATMSVSLEGREPLLDHRILEFASRLPSDFKLHNNQTKRIFRDVLYKYVPKELVDRPKQGFLSPVGGWLRNELNDYLRYYTDSERLKKQGVFDDRTVSKMVKTFMSSDGESPQKLWHFLVFQLWYNRWCSKL